jgi:hypothetical protein
MMSFFEYFKSLSELKGSTSGKKVSSVPDFDRVVMRDMANHIRQRIANNNIIVKPSVGQGYYSDVPWICLLSTNTNISPNAQKGLFIVILFSKTGQSLYVALSQGITNFKQMNLSSKQRDKTIDNTVAYFQKEVNIDLVKKYGFTTNKMNLGEYISTLAKGYIKTTILSKLYNVESFDENDFYHSIGLLLDEYIEMINYIGNKSYDDTIALINPSEELETVEDALENINTALKDEVVDHRDVQKTAIKVEKGALKANRFFRISQEKIYKKVDYLKQAKEKHQTGLIGEKLAMEIERRRLENLNINPDIYLKRVSNISDSYGYDIISADIRNGYIITIYIEVKSTKDINDSSFFVSKNELEVSKKEIQNYRIMRIFDLTSITPKYYYADGEIEENFYLDPVTYSARYKYETSIN